MITRKDEFVVTDVTVSHLIEVRSEEQTRDQDEVDDPCIGQRALHKTSTDWGIVSREHTDDYHSGLVRCVPRYQSNFLETPPDSMDLDMVWNERAVSVAIAHELAIVAECLGLAIAIERTNALELMKKTGLSEEFIAAHDINAIAEVVVALALGSNVVLDDPKRLMRPLMSNGNVIGFLDGENNSGGALIVSSYNQPCTKPGKRIMEMFPTSVLSSLMRDNFAKQVMDILGPYRGWVGGIFAPGSVSIGDGVFVNVAPTTPPLPE